MNGLEMPDLFAGCGIQSHKGGCIFILFRTAVTAVVIARGVAKRQIHIPQFLISRCHRPHVRRAAGVSLALTGFIDDTALPQIPGPQHVACNHVIATDNPRRGIVCLVVADLCTNHGNAAHDGRRCGHRVPAGHRVPKAVVQINHPFAPECGANLAGARIHRNQPRIQCPDQNAGRTKGVRIDIVLHMIGQTAAGRPIGDRILGHVRIISPLFKPGGRIQRQHLIHRCADKQRIANLQRGVFG